MLVLSRKEGERIQIADTITLTVLSVRGGKVPWICRTIVCVDSP